MFTGKRLTLALAIVAAAAVMLTVLGGSSVEAARGGKKGGGGGSTPPPSTATLTVSPNPAPLGTETFTVNGSGFAANSSVLAGVSGWLPWNTVPTDGGGSFSTVIQHRALPDTYTFTAYQGSTSASAAVTVCSTNPC